MQPIQSKETLKVYNINEVKNQVIDTSLVVSSLIGLIAYASSTISRFMDGRFNFSIFIESFILIVLLFITYNRSKFKSSLKALIIILLLTFFSLSDALIFGLWSSARVYLILVPFFSIIYFPYKRTIVFLLSAIVLFLLIGYFHHTGILSLPKGYEPNNYINRLFPWIINAIHIATVGLIVFFITRKFFRSFSDLFSYLEDRNRIISEKERNYREIFNSTGEAIFIHETESGKIVDVNPMMLSMFRFDSKDEIINCTVSSISSNIDPFTEENAKKYIKKAVQEGPQFFEWMAKKKNGELFWIEVSLYSSEIGGIGRVMAVVRDYTERRKVEKALAESEKKYREMNELLPQTVFEADANGKLIYVNKTGLNFFRLTEEDFESGINIFQQISPEEREKAYKNFSITIKNQPVDSNQYLMLRKDGSTFPAQIYSKPFEIDEKNNGIRGIVVDITERVHAERIIRESEYKYRTLMESMNEVVIMVDNDDRVQFVNKMFTIKLGYQPDEIIGEVGFKLLANIDDKDFIQNTDHLLIDNLYHQYEVVFLNKSGQKLNFLLNSAPIHSAEGKSSGFILALVDITERKKAEKALKESQQKFMILAEMSPVGIFRTRVDGYTIYVNPKWTELSGISSDEALGDGWLKAVHPDDKKVIHQNWYSNTNAGTKSIAEYRFINADGRIKWVLGNAVPEIIDGEIQGYIGTITDITDIKIAQQKLENSEKRFREMADLLPQTIWEANLEGRILYLNNHGLQLYGYTEANISAGLDLLSNLIPEEKERARINFQKRLSGEKTGFGGEEYTGIKVDGTIFPVKVYVSVIKEQGKPVGLRGITIDISDIKKAEEELRESEARYRTIIEAFPDIIMLSDLDGNIVFGNEIFKQITGIFPRDYNNLKRKARIYPDDVEKVRNAIQDLLNSKKKHTEIIENRFIDADGKMHWFSGNISKIVLSGQTLLQTITRDITEKKAVEQELEKYRNQLELLVKVRTDELAATIEELSMSNEELLTQRESLENTLVDLKKMQEQLVQSEKMASLGVLAAGVAHEINNPLNFINGGVLGIESYLNEQIPEKINDLSPLFTSVYEGVNRVSSIVASLNHYSRKDEVSTQNCDIHSIIDNCLVILQNKMKHRIELHKKYTTKKYISQCNEGRLHQAFLNILSNACQAIPDKGTITIGTRIEQNYLIVKISDSGIGISKKDLKRIMDPFFTTKEPGKGTGLGLSITYNIITEHQGILECESEPGKGSTFTVKLPVQLS